MRNTEFANLVLMPLAMVAVDSALRGGSKVEESFIDQVAEQLYQRHRGEMTSSVQERRFSMIPNSERGKYRTIVREAIEQFRNSRLFGNKF